MKRLSWNTDLVRKQRILRQMGKPVTETERIKVEANEDKKFELKVPVSPCR